MLPNNTHISLKSLKLAFKNNLLHSKIPNKRHNNLTKEQRAGILALQNNPEIVIKKADKGSAVVVINIKDYVRKGYRQVIDPKFYTKLDHDLQMTLQNSQIANMANSTYSQNPQKGNTKETYLQFCESSYI